MHVEGKCYCEELAWRWWVSPVVTNPDRGCEQIQQIPFTNPEIFPVFEMEPIGNVPIRGARSKDIFAGLFRFVCIFSIW